MRIRQIALAAHDLEPVVEDLCAVLGIEVIYRDPGVGTFGLCNAVMRVGETFLEVVSPTRPDTAAGRWLSARGGDCGYMVIAQTKNLDEDRERLSELGVRIVWEAKLDDISAVHLHPKDVGGAILSLDQPVPPESWRWAGPDWQRMHAGDSCARISGVELQADDPEAMALRWARVLARPQIGPSDGCFEIRLEDSSIRFVPTAGAPGEQITAVELAVANPQAVLRSARQRGIQAGDQHVSIGGVRFDLR